MKNIVLLFLFFVPAFLFAQYPTGTNKSRLGYQTTGDGLIWRGVAADTAIKPRTTANAYFQLDTVNRVLRRYIATQGSWQVVGGITPADTAAMLSAYISLAGYGLSKTAIHTLGVDTTLISTKTYTNRFLLKSDTAAMLSKYIERGDTAAMLSKYIERGDTAAMLTNYVTFGNLSGYPTGTGTADRLARWTGTNTLAAGNLTDNGTKLQALLPWQFQTYTAAGLPTGVTGYHVYNTTTNGPAWYQGSRWAYGLESSANTFPANRLIYMDTNQQATSDAGITYTASTGLNLAATTTHPLGQLNIAGTTTNSTGVNTITPALGITTTLNATVANTKRYGIYVNPTFTGTASEFAGITIAAKSQYAGSGNAALVIPTSSSNGIYITGTASVALIDLIPTNSTSRALRVLNTTDNNFGSAAILRTSSTVGVGTGMRFSVAQSGVSDSQCGFEIGASLAVNSTIFRDDLVFRAVYSDGGTFTSERARLTSYGLFGVGTASPTEMIHSADDIRVGDSLRIGTLPNQTSATKILSADANGWVGYRAFSDFASTWLKTELEASRDVTINGGSSTDFRIQNSRVQFDGKFKVGSDSTFWHDPSSNDTYMGGIFTTPYMRSNSTSVYSDVGAFISSKTTYGSNQGSYFTLTNKSSNGWGGGFYINNFPGVGIGQNLETGWQVGRESGRERYGIYHYYGDVKTGLAQNYLEVMQDTAYVPGGAVSFIRLGGQTGNTSKFLWFSSTGFSGADTVHFKFNNTNGTGLSTSRFFVVQDGGTSRFVIRKDGVMAFNSYGQNARTATALSKTATNQIANFATDGTILELEQKRDTTIYVDDADYDWSAAITTAQIASRYNRVIFLMTTTAGAGSDSELTLHTPDSNLMQVEYLVRSTDETGGFTNVIKFGTNNAVASDNALASTYTPSPGQGVGIRAGLRSGVYKYFYY